ERPVEAVLLEVARQAALLLDQLERALGVVQRRLDLAAVAHDALVLQEPLDVALPEARHALEVEVGEGGAEVLALPEDRDPRESGLEPLQADLLVEAPVVALRKAPF